jgi:hypothetical protein
MRSRISSEVAEKTTFLLSNLRRVIGKNSDLRPTVFKVHDAAAIFGGEDDPFANRPLIVTAFPLGIQYLPVILSKHIVGRGVTDNRAPIAFLVEVGLKCRETEANQQQHNQALHRSYR